MDASPAISAVTDEKRKSGKHDKARENKLNRNETQEASPSTTRGNLQVIDTNTQRSSALVSAESASGMI